MTKLANPQHKHDSLVARYWVVRKQLEAVPASKFTIGELQDINVLLARENTPGSAPRGDREWLKANISKMESLIPKPILKRPT